LTSSLTKAIINKSTGKIMIQANNSLQQSHEQLAKEEAIIQYNAPAMQHPFLNINGKSPSATMQCKFFPHEDCPGFPRGAISMRYDIPKGAQASYHPNPGVQYDGTRRIAYIPNSPEGYRLLTRMKVAFHRGFMFSVGKSLASGRNNQVTWTNIPNKTSLHGGAFGFPDKKYISKANLELDKAGIPSANDSLPMVQQFSCDAEPNQGTKYPFKAETITYIAPEELLAKNDVADILKPLPSTSFSPSAPLARDRNLPSAPTFPVSVSAPLPASSSVPVASQPPVRSMQPAQIITADDLISSQTNFAPSQIVPIPNTANARPTASSSQATCTICLTELCNEKSAEIVTCHHAFHEACILDALNHIDKCPVCRKPISGKPQGKSPSGTMEISVVANPCPGFVGCNTIQITYNIPSGIQKPYHESPQTRHDGTCRAAYIPNNDEGRGLLLRLKYAFRSGLTFRVGTSLTTGQKNQVTWTSIHHKTSISGGVHGFPDDVYISNCNSSLDALHVPPPDKCGT
jgi:deltex-like protein